MVVAHWLHPSLNVCVHYVCMCVRVCIYVCVRVCIYVCMYVCTCVHKIEYVIASIANEHTNHKFPLNVNFVKRPPYIQCTYVDRDIESTLSYINMQHS